jgi:hypothetical protein
MRAGLVRLAVASCLLAGIAAPTSAQDRWHDERRGWQEHRHEDRGVGHREIEQWRDRDVHRFRDHDVDRWRAGRWYHGRHDGRVGWWIVGGVWYFYPQPVYPYPDPYRPPVVAGPPPPAASYYYCDQPPAYYPYVPSCPSGWRTVPAG